MKRFFLMLLLVGLTLPARADLTIEITKGLEGALPIAVVPFAWRGDAGRPPPHEVAGVVAAAPYVLRAVDHASQPRARVAALNTGGYGSGLADLLARGIAEYPEVVERARELLESGALDSSEFAQRAADGIFADDHGTRDV